MKAVKGKVKSLGKLSSADSPDASDQVESLLGPKDEPDKLLRLQPELCCVRKTSCTATLALIAGLKKHALLSLACVSVIFLHHVVGE